MYLSLSPLSVTVTSLSLPLILTIIHTTKEDDSWLAVTAYLQWYCSDASRCMHFIVNYLHVLCLPWGLNSGKTSSLLSLALTEQPTLRGEKKN